MSHTSPLPDWAIQLRNRYLAGESSLFLLHGNVRDLHLLRGPDGGAQWLDIRRFLERFLGKTRDITCYYNVSQGLCFPDKTNRSAFKTLIDAGRTLHGEPPLTGLPRDPAQAIPLLEELMTNPSQTSGVIIDYFETIAPNADVSFMSTDDKANLVSMQRWSSDIEFLGTDNIGILISQHLADVSRRVVASPQLSSILVPYPDLETRITYLEMQDISHLTMEMSLEHFAKTSAGLTLTQLRSILRSAEQSGEPITFKAVAARKKRIIEQECHGLVEFVSPNHDFSHVGGMERIKADLIQVADAVKAGQHTRVPMGMIFVGPMGTGKTFLAEAFAAESGLTCLKFKNFREKWVGSTEANLEKILDLVEALGFVLLIIDEADRSLSSGGSDGGTNSRVIARLKEFMSDSSHRGRVVILMMTNRPDKLDTDLKRPGRFDMKIPFFFPETAKEREHMMTAVARKNRLQLDPTLSFEMACEHTDGYSAAELEAVMLAAASRAAIAGSESIQQVHLNEAAGDVIPSRDVRMLDYMEMLAVFETSARRMLPDRFRELSTDEVLARLDTLKMQLGRRAL